VYASISASVEAGRLLCDASTISSFYQKPVVTEKNRKRNDLIRQLRMPRYEHSAKVYASAPEPDTQSSVARLG
jgi:hypothetical protein